MKTKLELTKIELDSILNIISTIEATIGCSDNDDNENDFDTQIIKDIKVFDKMLKKNGYIRK